MRVTCLVRPSASSAFNVVCVQLLNGDDAKGLDDIPFADLLTPIANRCMHAA